MEVRFEDSELDQLETDADFHAGLSQALVKAFRKKIQLIRSAPDERTLYAFKALHFKQLDGNRSHQHSIRLNDQWRLILQFEREAASKRVVVVGIEDYH